MWLELDQSGRGRTGDHPDRQPWTARAANSHAVSFAAANSARPTAAATRPPATTRLRPTRSDSCPHTSSVGTNRTMYVAKTSVTRRSRTRSVRGRPRTAGSQVAAEQQREERHRQDQERPAGAFGRLTQVAATARRHWCKVREQAADRRLTAV